MGTQGIKYYSVPETPRVTDVPSAEARCSARRNLGWDFPFSTSRVVGSCGCFIFHFGYGRFSFLLWMVFFPFLIHLIYGFLFVFLSTSRGQLLQLILFPFFLRPILVGFFEPGERGLNVYCFLFLHLNLKDSFHIEICNESYNRIPNHKPIFK